MTRKHPLAICEECPLYADGQFVPSSGPKRAKLAFVGEAPGVNEARGGEPFVGESGQLLNTVLKHYDISRREVFLTNACLCRDPSGANPTAKAIQACRPRLLAELREREVQDVVALGNSAAQSVLRTKVGITALRVGQGRTNEDELPGVRVLPTFHPAACLRVPGFFPSLVNDVGKLRGFHASWYEPKWRAYEDVPEALAALHELEQRRGPVVVDIESDIEKDVSFETPTRHHPLCVGLGFEPGKVAVLGERAMQDGSVRYVLRRYLASRQLIGQNLKFDNKGLWAWLGEALKVYFDTMLASYCVAPGTRVLKRDLTWVAAENLSVGDEVIAFDEKFNNGTSMKPATVLATKEQKAPCYKITTRQVNGYHGNVEAHEIICSAQHIWPVKLYGQGQTQWKTAAQLDKIMNGAHSNRSQIAPRLLHFADPWEVDNTREGGYIAGILDGEGTLSDAGNSSWRLSYAQNPGPVLDRVRAYLKERNIDVTENSARKGTTCVQDYIAFGSRGTIRALGTFRPARWMNDTDRIWEGRRKFNSVEVESIEYVGERYVIGIETTERTFIAEGFLTHNCLDERPGIHALDYQAIELLGAPSWKNALNKYKRPGEGYGVIPRDVLYKYNALDVHATGMLADVRMKQLEEEGQRALHDFLCRASDQLMYVELNGIAVDKAYNAELAVNYIASLAILDERIAGAIPLDVYRTLVYNQTDPILPVQKRVLENFNSNSPQQVKEVVSNIFGLKLPMAMNQKREYVETTNAEALEGLLEKSLGGPAEEFFRRMLEHRKEAKFYGTYVKGLRKRMYRGRVYPTFLLHGTTTGRLSCRNPNLQNIPRDSVMRRQFVPARQGFVFVEGDYAQNEGRVLAWLAKDKFLQEVFNDPTRDIFDELTPRLYGDVSGLSKPEMKELRIRVKAYFYGLAYGREARSIAIEYDLPMDEAERGMRAFFEVIPDTVRFREQTRKKVLSGEDLVTPRGRHRRFWLITNSNRKDVLNEALAFLPQSIASDICLDAFIHIRPRLKGLGYIRNIVHDSLLSECHPDNVMEVTTIMNEEMLAAAARIVGDFVKFKVDFKSGPNWGDLT